MNSVVIMVGAYLNLGNVITKMIARTVPMKEIAYILHVPQENLHA